MSNTAVCTFITDFYSPKTCGRWKWNLFDLEIVILHISALNLYDSQTLVIAATSCAVLFEEIIMESDNEGKGLGYILQSTFFSLSRRRLL